MQSKKYNRIHLIGAFSLGLIIAIAGLFAAQNNNLFKGELIIESGTFQTNGSGKNSEVKITEAPINSRESEGEDGSQTNGETNLNIESGSIQFSNNDMIDYDPNRFIGRESDFKVTDSSDPEALRMEIETLKKTIESLKLQCGLN